MLLSRTRAVVTLAFALALWGCSAASAPVMPGPTCQPPACAYPTNLAVEVAPPSDSTSLLANEFTTAIVDPATGELQLTMETPVTLSGTVRIGTGTAGKLVPSTLLATRPSRIQGLPDLFYSATIDPTTGLFHLPVTRTVDPEVYTLRVIAADPSQYPSQTFQFAVAGDTKVDLTIDDPSLLMQVNGRLTDQVMAPIKDLQVQALDVVSHSLVSTVSVTNANGDYSIRLSGQAAMKNVILQALPVASAAGKWPELELTLDTTRPGANNTILPKLVMPPLFTAQPFFYKVIGISASGATMPVVGAACQFAADVSDPAAPGGITATFTASGVTDQDGTVAVSLIPSSQSARQYRVIISPTASSEFQATNAMVQVGQQGGYGPNIMLDLRPVVTGRVLDPAGAPIKNVNVLPAVGFAAKLLNVSSLAQLSQLPSVLTPASGRFAVKLDSGTYDLGFAPDASSGLAREWLTGLSVIADKDLGDTFLRAGASATALVFSPSGAPLGAATVKIYTVPVGNSACAPGELACVAPPRLVAQGATDANGRASLVLPPPGRPVSQAQAN